MKPSPTSNPTVRASRVIVHEFSRRAGVPEGRCALSVGVAPTVWMTADARNEIIGHRVGRLGHRIGYPPTLSHPVHPTRVVCEVANERGVSTSDVLAGTAIDPADLTKPDAMV